MVLDCSDDESEDAVNLASPGVPRGQTSKTLPLEELNVHEQTDDKVKLKEDKSTVGVPNQLFRQDSSIVSKGIGSDAKENVIANVGLNSPKRSKVLKTRIDERGREVTEVVWEGEEQEIKKAEDNSVANAVNRAPANKKSPAVGNAACAPSHAGGKAGTKKGAIKDSKQGNILSFFKRV
uniref:Uncharacterized protein LOC105109677 isoform X2 n=1 Tax=Rhizophora mucronata TaxID=61149 RepID=A0A2P2Q4D0_RHIMU